MEYMSCPEAAKKAGTDTLQGETHTGCFKTWVYVVDTKRRGKTD